MDEKCIVCGSVIPEGRQVCPTCERKSRSERCCPCKDCERREIGCHASCQDYIAWREWKDKENEWLRSLVGPESKRAKAITKQKIMRRARGYEKRGRCE